MPERTFTGILYYMIHRDKRADLMAALEYILNDCGLREIDAIEAAVTRRRKDLESSTGSMGLDPSKVAGRMSRAIQDSIDQSMEGMRRSLREYAVGIIAKEAPELGQEQIQELLDSWMPPVTAGAVSERRSRHGGFTGESLVCDGVVNGVPVDVLREMVYQFTAYSSGSMSLKVQSELRDSLGDWTTKYWHSFPAEIQALIKKYLADGLTADEFGAVLDALLQ